MKVVTVSHARIVNESNAEPQLLDYGVMDAGGNILFLSSGLDRTLEVQREIEEEHDVDTQIVEIVED